jgi:hypothetical protein
VVGVVPLAPDDRATASVPVAVIANIANHDAAATTTPPVMIANRRVMRGGVALDEPAAAITAATMIGLRNTTQEAKSQRGEGEDFEHHDRGIASGVPIAGMDISVGCIGCRSMTADAAVHVLQLPQVRQTLARRACRSAGDGSYGDARAGRLSRRRTS